MHQHSIALEPSKGKDRRKLRAVPLKGYEHLPASERPTVYLRNLSWRRYRQALDIYESIAEQGMTAHRAMDSSAAVLRLSLADWENVTDEDGNPAAFDLDRLEDVLSFDEAAFLVLKVLKSNVEEADLKNSTLPPASGSAASASDALPASA